MNRYWISSVLLFAYTLTAPADGPPSPPIARGIPDTQYFRYVFGSMANPKQSISENMFFESAFTVKFGLTAPERLTLHNLAQEFQVVLTRLHTQSRALYAAAKGRRFTADEQRQLSDVAIAFDVGVNDLGARLLANVRPAAARRIQNAINGTN